MLDNARKQEPERCSGDYGAVEPEVEGGTLPGRQVGSK